MDIIIKNVLIKTYHFINIIKYYHRLPQYNYSIITTKIPNIKFKLASQMFFKAIKNLKSCNKIVFILLVFDTFFRMTKLDAFFLLIT